MRQFLQAVGSTDAMPDGDSAQDWSRKALPALVITGRWKSSEMPAHFTERQAADRGRWHSATTRVGVNITGSCGQRGFEPTAVGQAVLYYNL